MLFGTEGKGVEARPFPLRVDACGRDRGAAEMSSGLGGAIDVAGRMPWLAEVVFDS